MAAYIFGYVILSAIAGKLFLDRHSSQVEVWAFVVAWFIGWFLMLGLLTTHDQANLPGMTIGKRLKEGLNLLKSWAWGMAALVLVAVIFSALIEANR